MCIRDSCFTITIKGVISDLIGVLYLFCFHCTYDDRVDSRNNINTGVISVLQIVLLVSYKITLSLLLIVINWI